MTALTIKNIPESLYKELKAVAQAHRRSINNEVIVLLEKTLMPQKTPVAEHIRKARELRQSIQPGVVSAEDILNAINEGRL